MQKAITPWLKIGVSFSPQNGAKLEKDFPSNTEWAKVLNITLMHNNLYIYTHTPNHKCNTIDKCMYTNTLKTHQSCTAGIHGKLEGLEPEMNPDEYHNVCHSE